MVWEILRCVDKYYAVNMVPNEPRPKCAKLDRILPAEEIRINPILHISLTREEVPLVKFYVIQFTNKRNIGNFLNDLPLIPEKFSFLKRVDKNGCVLIQPISDPISAELLHVLSLYKFTTNDLQVVMVPESKPHTQKQFNWAKLYWPTTFHSNKDIENVLSGMYFQHALKQKVWNWSIKATEMGCIVVQGDEELASGSRNSCLLGHPVMTMISNLAKSQRSCDEYLATGCDVFLKDEPCGMCAMALVHCRAARVFFVRKSRNGVLCSGDSSYINLSASIITPGILGKWQLHLESVLNHHYKVFYVDLFSDDSEISTCGT